MYNLSYFLKKIFFFLSLSEQVGLQEVLGGGAGSAPGRQCQGSGRFWGSGRAMVTPMEGRCGVECQTRVRRGSVHGGGLTQGVGATQGKEGALWGAPWCSLCPDESAPMPVPYDPRTHVRLGKRHSQHTLHLRPRRSDRHLLLLYESLRGGGRVGGVLCSGGHSVGCMQSGGTKGWPPHPPCALDTRPRPPDLGCPACGVAVTRTQQLTLV